MPRVLNSPRVRSMIPIFFPASLRLKIVPPQFNSASSGCAAKNTASALFIFESAFLIGKYSE
ncbi:MAG TPA: hypothetical protein PKC91_04465 [Ignavibacteria bacterium]|nr:hypothetical protein [Ignavibacteria bacterium]